MGSKGWGDECEADPEQSEKQCEEYNCQNRSNERPSSGGKIRPISIAIRTEIKNMYGELSGNL